MKTKSLLSVAALAATVLMTSTLVYADDSAGSTQKPTNSGTLTHQSNGSYNDTSHTQTDADQTKAAAKSKNAPGD
jgi:hypothetical protein